MSSETSKSSSSIPSQVPSIGKYLLLWGGQQISMLGSSIVHFSVVWWLTVETVSSSIVSIASICFYLPVLLLGPFVGVIADRYSRKKILLISDLTQALLTLILIFFFIFDIYQIWHILLLITLRAICQAFQFPVNLAIVPSMVPEEKLGRMNTLNQIFMSLNQIASPALGALAYRIWDMRNIFWIDVFSFIPAAIVLLSISIPKVRTEDEERKMFRKTFFPDFKEGLVYIKNSKLIWLLAPLMISNFFESPLTNMFSIFIYGIHNGTENIYAFTQIFFYAGLFAMSLFLMIKRLPPALKYVIIGRFIYSTCFLLLGVIPVAVMWPIYTLMAIIGAIISVLDIQFIGVLQKLVPRELAGRVFSTSLVLVKISMPIGLLIIGFLGESINLRWIYIVGPIISIICFILLLLFSPILQLNENENLQLKRGIR